MKDFEEIKFKFLICQVLKERRDLLSLSQQKVIVDVFEKYDIIVNVGGIEKGDDDISQRTLFLLCEYYRISVSDFFKRVKEIDSDINLDK